MDKLRVWWIPQVGATEGSFYVPVETVEEGKKSNGYVSSI